MRLPERLSRLCGALLVACAAGFLAVAGPVGAVAQQAADTSSGEEETFSPEHLRKAQRVIDLTRSAEGFDEILSIVAEQTTALFVRNHPGLTREIEAVTTEKALEMAASRRELNETLQKIWARRFTEEDLDVLIEFFSSPVGQRFAESSATIAALSVGASQQWGNRLATEMVTEVREELRARGHPL